MAIIGIDLGTFNSSAAGLPGGRPVIIDNAERFSLGGKAFASFIALTAGGEMLVVASVDCKQTMLFKELLTMEKNRPAYRRR